MEEQDTSVPRDDDRNDELEESPAPDPEEGEPRADDDPSGRLTQSSPSTAAFSSAGHLSQ